VKFNDVMRNILKIVMSVAWCIILPLFYVNSSTNVNLPFDLTKYLRQIKGVPQLYLFAVALYLLPNILAAALFVFPMFRRWIENSDWLIIRFLLWWSQVMATMLHPVKAQQKKRLLRRR
jgi:callose synthase